MNGFFIDDFEWAQVAVSRVLHPLSGGSCKLLSFIQSFVGRNAQIMLYLPYLVP
jgi:hypothetical protein